MHLGAFGRNGGHQAGIEHRELGRLELDDDGIVGAATTLPSKGWGSMAKPSVEDSG
jgi:hypothetical protein